MRINTACKRSTVSLLGENGLMDVVGSRRTAVVGARLALARFLSKLHLHLPS
jgi:hypothetical protein